MKKYFLSVIVYAIALGVILFASGCAPAALTPLTVAGTTTGSIFCYVYVPSAQARDFSKDAPTGYVPLVGARVSVVGYNKYAITDQNGYAEIRNVAQGSYTVTVGKDGYQTISYNSVSVAGGITSSVGSTSGIQIGASTTPGIMDLSSSRGPIGTLITITGSNFGSSQGTSTVTFNGISATSVTGWSATQITCRVPAGASTGNLVVNVGSQSSNAVTFTISAGSSPTITELSPSSAMVGSSVTIKGTNFGASQGSSTVTFSGVTVASITSWSAAQIVFTVPSGATSGNVIVTVGGEESNSSPFTVTTESTYAVTYNGNGNNGGTAPVDSNSYTQGNTVTVLGNTGSLTKTANIFSCWNTQADGSGTDYAANSTFTMGTSNVTLYAKWVAGYNLRDTGPAGGLIFYKAADASAGWQYMEAAPSDQSTALAWSATNDLISTGTYIGAGKTNTNSIVAFYGAGETYAAGLCDSLTLGDYNDWFLPSKDELGKMYRNLASGIDENSVIFTPVGDFAVGDNAYWSSSGNAVDSAWKTWFATGSGYNVAKSGTLYVRAARRF